MPSLPLPLPAPVFGPFERQASDLELDVGAASATTRTCTIERRRCAPPPLVSPFAADLEEVFENLIMDQLDVGAYGPALLDPDFELDHVFD